MRHKKTMEDIEAMVYLLLHLWPFIRLSDNGFGFYEVISLIPGSLKQVSYSLLMSHFHLKTELSRAK